MKRIPLARQSLTFALLLDLFFSLPFRLIITPALEAASVSAPARLTKGV